MQETRSIFHGLPTFAIVFVLSVGCWFTKFAASQVFETFGTGENQFSIQFVLVGNPGNPPAQIGAPVLSGSVPYVYRIGKFEITRDQYTKASTLGGLGLTVDPMSFVNGSNGIGPRPNMPATGLTWNEAARFVNWLNTSQGFPPAYNFAEQPGQPNYNPNSNILLWDIPLSAVDGRGVNRYRHKDCRYFLPSLDEWFKAAYYDPRTNNYTTYPTGSSAPVQVPSGSQAGTAVYDFPNSQGPADADFCGGLSAYGAMGLGGNVWELEETAFNVSGGYNQLGGEYRGGRGGAWNGLLGTMAATSRLNSSPNQRSNRMGFRVASVAGANVADAQVVGASVFYGDSSFSGDDIQNAIDPTKSLARQGSGPVTLSYQNLINTAQGINGVVFDVQNLASPGSLGLGDFEFRVSPTGAFDEASNPPNSWAPAPNPTRITVRSGNPSRVVIEWHSGQILNRWLRIMLRSNANTGLQSPQSFFIGHLIGKTLDSTNVGLFTVQFTDVSLVRQRIGQLVGPGETTDIDKNGRVQFADLNLARSQVGISLRIITVP